ncbi:LOW QUALITY PROTEIN: receptor-like protein 43, partial [Populus alba x Populus x berolinensis]
PVSFDKLVQNLTKLRVLDLESICLWLHLNGNELEGKIPLSIVKCTMLEFLNLGNNKIEDTFPYFLEMLPELKILVLKSNKLQGFMKGPITFNSFSKLRIFDISENNLSGPLPEELFNNLEGMISVDLDKLYMTARKYSRYTYSIKMTLKGLEIEFMKIQSILRVHDLSSNSFTGEIPKPIGKLKGLYQLNLSHNFLTGHIQSSLGSLTNLESLDMSSNMLTGRIPVQLTDLTYLGVLNLSQNKLEGPIPVGGLFHTFDQSSFQGNLGLCGFQVQTECNNGAFSLSLTQFLCSILFLFHFHTTISSSFSSNHSSSNHLCAHRQSLSLLQFKQSFTINSLASEYYCQYPFPKTESWKDGTDCCLWGGVTCDVKTGQVTGLDLSCSMLNGTLHSNNSLFSLHHLQKLDLSFNDFNSSHISSRFGQFSNLTHLNLNSSNFAGQVPLEVSHLSKLISLDLSRNTDLSVEPISFDKLVRNLTKLRELDLSSVNMSLVNFSGQIPSSFGNLVQLRYLDLSSNNFMGQIPDSFANLTLLAHLDLSNNQLNGTIPSFLFALPSLWNLDLHNNQFIGNIGEFQHNSLQYLDLSKNSLHGPIPSSIFNLENLVVLILASNSKLTWQVPSSICKLKFLQFLDLSNNDLGGSAPQCLGNFSNMLSVLHLGMNNLRGTIPSTFSEGSNLLYLDLSGNELEGKIPFSIVNCTKLEFLNLGNNKIEDTFPYFLEMLPELKILLLKSNKLQGFMKGPTTFNSFSKLRILDVSENNLRGSLPEELFNSLEEMMSVDYGMIYKTTRNYSSYTYSTKMTRKGLEIEFVKIQSILRILDLSSNSFTGEIPELIGKLEGLLLLNLSHNLFTGHIQSSLGFLTNLESLDMSSNMLAGRIPVQLTDLTFLEVLNLSQNKLEGPIPLINQFTTFDQSSYQGNLGLCGPPMPTECNNGVVPPLPPPNFNEGDDSTLLEDGFGWKGVAMGYGCGFVFGVTMGYIVFRTRRPAWFHRMVERQRNLKAGRTKKNARIYGARRN